MEQKSNPPNKVLSLRASIDTYSCVASHEHDLRMDSETSGPQGVPNLFVSTLLLPTVYILGKFVVEVDRYLPQQKNGLYANRIFAWADNRTWCNR